MARPFNSLETVQFQQRMRPAAIAIYRRVFPNCRVDDLREDGVNVHVLDREFGIDSLITVGSGQWLSIQEKYRRHTALKWLDFTQEYKNADGTQYESDGEWFKLGAQLYFYGWADESETTFCKWAILDIAKYKLLVEQAGGLHKLGTKRRNRAHGSASFYAIPIHTLEPAFVVDYRNPDILSAL
jgi:hypothetical protein